MVKRFVLLYNKSNPFGIRKDVELFEKVLSSSSTISLAHCDPLEAPVPCDMCIHFEVPIYSWQPYAATNVLLVNPEWYVSAYTPYLNKFDLLIFKNESARNRFVEKLDLPIEKTAVLPWAFGGWKDVDTNVQITNEPGMGFAWFIGASENRRAFARSFLPLWKDTYPQLTVFSVVPLDDIKVGDNVKLIVKDLDEKTRYKLANFYPGHICCSKSEGFGFTAAESESVGAFTILNTIEAFTETYRDEEGISWLPTKETASDPKHPFALYAQDPRDLRDLDSQILDFMKMDIAALREKRKVKSQDRYEEFHFGLLKLLGKYTKILSGSRPPILLPEACPPISVVTLLYNRKRFLDLACHSMILTDYPKDKIEWIFVDDTDLPDESVTEKVKELATKSAPLTIKYIRLENRTPVGEKRNIGCAAATAQIILMMDDDDHYPETSFRRRVAWLTLHPWKPKVVACTSIACYDLKKAVSAVNVPPFDIPLSERISEATLTFYKSWWEAKKFPSDVQVGEGETLLKKRETDLLEIPPQQIIVAFSHGQNVSSRRIPSGPDVNPGCFWGFPSEFLVFVHGLAGIKVETKAE
jgi:hypothetical protein